MQIITKSITKFICDVCEVECDSVNTAKRCEFKHKNVKVGSIFDISSIYDLDLLEINLFTFENKEQMDLFGGTFMGPGKYVYQFLGKPFIPLKDFVDKKKEKLKEFVERAERQLDNLNAD